MAFVLDTDTFSLFMRSDVAITRRVTEYQGLVYLSVVALRAVLKGALAAVADAESPAPQYKGVSVADSYDLMTTLVAPTTRFSILPYTDAAEAILSAYTEKPFMRLRRNWSATEEHGAVASDYHARRTLRARPLRSRTGSAEGA